MVTTVTVTHRYRYATVTFSPLLISPPLPTVTTVTTVTVTHRYRYATVTFHRYAPLRRIIEHLQGTSLPEDQAGLLPAHMGMSRKDEAT